MAADLAALTAQVRDSYATAAARAVYRERVDTGLRTWESTVVRDAFPAAGRVLTIGCGAGRETFALEQRGYATSGVDISPALLQIASQIGIARQHRCAFLLIDGEHLPFAGAVFDVVTLWAQMLDNVPGRAGRLALMREVRRVLRPGGLATFSAHDDARTRPGYDPGDVLLADVPEPGDLVVHERREAATRYCHLFSRDELAALTRDAGFTESTLHRTSELGEAWDNVFVGVCR
jgi:SAM-dependent methyltransferase